MVFSIFAAVSRALSFFLSLCMRPRRFAYYHIKYDNVGNYCKIISKICKTNIFLLPKNLAGYYVFEKKRVQTKAKEAPTIHKQLFKYCKLCSNEVVEMC